jgi:hypothetical protein
VTGSGSSTQFVAGFAGTGATGTPGYAVYSTADGINYSVNAIQPASSAADNGDYRLGVTFASAGQVWGKQSSQNLERSSFSLPSTYTALGSNALTSTGEAPMDYTVLDVFGTPTPFLATLDTNNSRVRIYDATDPTNLILVANATTTFGTLTANGNGVGQVKFGGMVDGSIQLYAMSTNQGIQAFLFNPVPEPTLLAGFALFGVAMARRTRGDI